MEHCLMYCKMFSSIPGLQPLGASSTPPFVTIKNVSRYRQMLSGKGWKQNDLQLRTTAIDVSQGSLYRGPLIKYLPLMVTALISWHIASICLPLSTKGKRLLKNLVRSIRISHSFLARPPDSRLLLQCWRQMCEKSEWGVRGSYSFSQSTNGKVKQQLN